MSVFIVAEIGVNAERDVKIAKQLVDAAAAAKVDACKLQMWQQETFPALERYRLEDGSHIVLKNYVESKGLQWFCTAFDFGSVKFLASLGMRVWKIPSNPIVFFDLNLARKIGELRPESVLVSLGAVPMDWQRNDFIRVYRGMFFDKMIPLHCVSRYPTPPESCNLYALAGLKSFMRSFIQDDTWGNWGISDHSGLPEIPIAAVALGAKVVECHITLDKNADGPDHKASLTPDEFAYMVKAIRNVEKAIG